MIGERLEISPTSITGIIIGGHSHNNLPLWNSVTIGGIHLRSENPSIGKSSDKENWSQLHTNVNQRQEQINQIKGVQSFSFFSFEDLLFKEQKFGQYQWHQVN